MPSKKAGTGSSRARQVGRRVECDVGGWPALKWTWPSHNAQWNIPCGSIEGGWQHAAASRSSHCRQPNNRK